MNNGGNGSQPPKASAFASYEGIRKRLRVHHDTDGLSWPKIAARDEYSPIPMGTLYDIYCGKKIPKKWYEKLNYPPPRPPRIAISLTDPWSAARTILEHMEPNNISMLIELLK